ncbi:MAG: hypothetical protein ACI802_001214 [Candidatus Paceibacteria bacterium]|jgi:hypothetical protein
MLLKEDGMRSTDTASSGSALTNISKIHEIKYATPPRFIKLISNFLIETIGFVGI